MDIKKPSVEGIKCFLEEFKSDILFTYSENALIKLFTKTYPQNKDIGDVLIKVCALNTIYSTNIMKTITVAQHIIELDIDNRLENGDIDLVNEIATVQFDSGKSWNFYSFATKYCSFHKPDIFPIYDSYIEKMLWHFNKIDNFYKYHRYEIKIYNVFYKILCSFIKYYGLSKCSFKEIDLYLWEAGKKYFPITY
jgi:hypothetical protein